MNAAIYARKSTDQVGIADDQKSVARQIEHARQYAARKGWTVSDEHVYVDDGISGAEFAARPGFLRLMNALKPRPAFGAIVMAEESRLGRESIEVGAVLKQIIQAGVRVFYYQDDRERTLNSPIEKIMMQLSTFGDELEREKARVRTADAMMRKARAGHVCGGSVFGYRNVPIIGPDGRRSHVEREIDQEQAAIIRRIFELAAAGEGIKNIAKRLNAERVQSPRPQQGRPAAWARSSVRKILLREEYRGRRVWNKTQKRDAWGQHHQRKRPASEWLTVDVEGLRIVSDKLWTAAHERIAARRAIHNRWERQPRAVGGLDVRAKYLLSGFGCCAVCGGSMQAISRSGRLFRYVCGRHWNRGATVCANGRRISMPVADTAVVDLLRDEVLTPGVVGRALDRALELLDETRDTRPDTRTDLERRLLAVETELANLAETAARGGAVPVVLDALARRDEERRWLTAQLAAQVPQQNREFRRASRDELRGFLDDWKGLLTGNVAEARPVLDLVLAGQRIGFAPHVDGGYELTVPIAYDRVISAAIPALNSATRRYSFPEGAAAPASCFFLHEGREANEAHEGG